MAEQVVPWRSRRGNDAALIAALASGASHAEAAQRSGVSERTVRRRLADDSFQAAIDQTRRESVRAVTNALRSQAIRAVATLGELMEDTQPPAVRLSAARTMLDHLIRYQQVADFSDRITELEAAVHTSGGSAS